MSFGSVSDRILKKLEEKIPDKNKRKFIIDLLEHEVRYESELLDKKTIKREFQFLIEQYYPFEDQNE